jgi:MFS family permease
MSHKTRSIYNARLMYLGVALGAGGVAFYVPLMLSQVGQHFSGVWAASILFATNLGRTLGSHFGSRHSFFTERPAAIVSSILLEGLALFSMALLHAPWAFATVALAAGLGSGLSFPGLKNYLLKLKDLDSARLFAGLSMAIRLGMLFGYLSGALVTARHMTAVFTAILMMFIGYATFMRLAIGHPCEPAVGTASSTRARFNDDGCETHHRFRRGAPAGADFVVAIQRRILVPHYPADRSVDSVRSTLCSGNVGIHDLLDFVAHRAPAANAGDTGGQKR